MGKVTWGVVTGERTRQGDVEETLCCRFVYLVFASTVSDAAAATTPTTRLSEPAADDTRPTATTTAEFESGYFDFGV